MICPNGCGPLTVGGVGVHVSVYQGAGVDVTIPADICLACGYRKAHQDTMPVPDLRRVGS